MTSTVPAASDAPRRVADEDADLALLTGEGAVDVVGSALVGDDPLPPGLRVVVAGVHHRPGAGVSVCYEVSHDGAPAPEVVVASTAEPSRHDRTDRVAVLDDGVRRIRVWRRADDPALPGLRSVLDPAVVARWLGATDGVRVTLLSYRPTRRAVVVARTASATVYVKVVRPRRAEELVRRHQVLAEAPVPAPRVLDQPEPGVVVLACAPGRSLAQTLAAGEPVPTADAVLAMLRGLPDAVATLPRRPSWVDRLDFHAAAARSALPSRAGEVTEVAERVTALLAVLPEPALVPTHGDLNVANLFVTDGRPSALIDVDALGPGHLEDDLATVLAHLAVLPSLAPAQYTGVPAVLADWLAVLAGAVGARGLLARTAAVLVSLVAGAAPAQAHARLDLAVEMLRRAEGAAA